MSTITGRISLVLAAGALAGLAQAVIIVVCAEFRLFHLLGLPLDVLLRPAYLYQRFAWGALWGLLFLLPLARGLPHARRGLIFAAGPAAGSLFYFLPFRDGHGWLGLRFGAMMPVVVIVFALLWGWMAGLWLDRAEGRAGSARE
jgi:hypothetical protein